ncbi:MAG: 2-oxo acid dehydrogenase subunit E2 [Chloroflexi bacterium]|nr:MAG: 2-oxo acid dehydrogenase subunit E2 [Chloroflexota bacterium]MBL1195488.1 2-oxo acid dehydrogenase subunit E2 [Chloroflexota bacterium]NOH12770.1 2-oxo acid dehydrogenase subunit E2 [Chloroflexota bacterium]
MATEVILPKVDMDQETGTIVEWVKKDGEEVTEGEIILVIETDKVAIDVEAPATGVLQGISAAPGEVLPIATVIAHILEPGEELPQGPMPPPPTPQETLAEVPPSTVPATPVARKMAAAHEIDLQQVNGSGQQGQVTKADVVAVVSSPPATAPDGKVYAAPAARRVASELGVDLNQVQGTGPGGRIQSVDVTAAAQSPQPMPIEVQSSSEPEVIPLVGMRRTIAERLTASYQSIPHINFTARILMDAFIATRATLNEHAERAGEARISATALLVKLVSIALQRHPWVNSSFTDEAILLHRSINVGVAVALEEGLIVPVVHDADKKGIALIGTEVSDLATRARAGQLLPSEVGGGTFTISNLGPFGVEQFEAIINPPQAAILAVGMTQQEAVPLDNGEIVAKPVMHITLSADHRVIDGAVAANFMAELKSLLENPILLSY